MSTGVDAYLRKNKLWKAETEALREVLCECELDEQIKWGKPCYSADESNIAIIQNMKGFVSLMFFKGALLEDKKGLLKEQGRNTRSAKRMEFTSVEEVVKQRTYIKRLVREAVKVDKAGLKVDKPAKLELVAELEKRLKKDRALGKAFSALTPGRQREYNIFVSGAKLSETRERRIDKFVEKILAGKGMRDR